VSVFRVRILWTLKLFVHADEEIIQLHERSSLTKITSVARYIGFYTGSADHVHMENVNKYVGSSWLRKRECLNIVF